MRIRTVLALVLLILTSIVSAQFDVWRTELDKQKPYRVISYNILVGFTDYSVGDPYMKGEDRLKAAQKWLSSQQPDVVGLQELNGYTVEKLKEQAKAWGHENVVLLKESGYDIGLTAKSPITVIERLVIGMHHGMLHVRVDDLDIIVTHFYPAGDYDRKMQEAEIILERVSALKQQGRECIVMGDLNACTREDEPLFGDVAREWHTKWNWDLVNDYPHYGTVDKFLRKDFTDFWAKHRPQSRPQFPGRPRVDFILATPGLAKLSVGAKWVDTDYMHRISDHAPLVADFNFKRS